LILLLAGRHLPAELFDQLAREVESLFFVYVITREATRDFEKTFASWAGDIRKCKTQAELSTFIEKSFVPARKDLSARFDDAFRRLYASSVQQYRLRYVLAKLTQSVELAAYGETEGTKWLSKYTDGSFEIEHILPQTPCAEARAEFGTSLDADVAQRIGNLTLVEGSINASLGNRAYSKKRDVYRQSQLLLTRAIAERPRVGTHTQIDEAVKGIEPFAEWNESNVTKRQDMIRNLARKIWQVPAPTS